MKKYITSRSKNFSQWYTDLLLYGNLIDYGVVAGTIILKPNGYALWQKIVNNLDYRFSKYGICNVYLPLLIPQSLFNQEKEHIKGFAPECAIVTHIGTKKLSEPLIIRPTSEVLFGAYFSKNVSTYKELPLKYNQWVNVIRWEKSNRPFLRSNEFLWHEGHSVHNNSKEASDFAKEMMNLYVSFFKEILAIPVLFGKKSEHEKFAGAEDTYTLEALMLDGQALQSATSHYFGQKFAKAFDIQFTNSKNVLEYGYQTSWGLSTRVIGALVMSHSDDNGLVLPPLVAPIQIKIITIGNLAEVNQQAELIFSQLNTKYRVVLDKSDKNVGQKFMDADLQGIPFVIEIGIRELNTNQVSVLRRDEENRKLKKLIGLANLDEYFISNIKSMQNDLYLKTKKRLIKHCYEVYSFKEYVEKLKQFYGFFGAWFCNNISCEEEIKLITKTVSRCQDLEKQSENAKCFKCQQKAQGYFYFARAY